MYHLVPILYGGGWCIPMLMVMMIGAIAKQRVWNSYPADISGLVTRCPDLGAGLFFHKRIQSFGYGKI